MSTIRINGKDEALAAATVAELLLACGVERPKGVAVALNGSVVPRAAWHETRLSQGDVIEIVRPFGGG